MSLRFLWLVALCVVWPSSAALAFCRTTTLDAGVDDCVECPMLGPAVAWATPDIEVVFADEVPMLAPGEQRRIVAEAFATWQSVRCGDEPVNLDVQIAEGSTTLGPRDAGTEPATNVIGYLTNQGWAEQGYDRFAFAQTTVRFIKSSGRLAGADIWLHGEMRLQGGIVGRFGVCPDQGCDELSPVIDLPNVMTHEIGHFFGLSHSTVAGATMACSAVSGETGMRSLEQDDRDGLCAIYPPDIAFHGAYEDGGWQAAPRARSKSCSAAPGHAAPVWWQLGLCAMAALALIRRRPATSLRR